MHPDPLDRLIQAADTPLDPRPEFADVLLNDLLARLNDAESNHAGEENTMNQTIALTPSAEGARSHPERWRTPRRAATRDRSLLPSYLATAALLLLTLAGGLYAVGGGRNLGLLHQTSPGVEHELIAQGEIESIPDDLLIRFTGISRFTLEPGETLESGPDTYYGDGLYLFEVESGTLFIASTGPMELMTGRGDQGTPLSAGANATLQAGDRGATSLGTLTTWRNDGQDPTVVLVAAAGELTDTAIEVEQKDLVKSFTIGVPEPPVTLAFHRLTFEPGASLPVADLPGLMMIGIQSGEIDVPLTNADGSIRDRGFGTLEGFVTTDWDLATEGDLRNSGTEPTVIYVLTGESTGPAATPES
jgi:hypothetical protein